MQPLSQQFKDIADLLDTARYRQQTGSLDEIENICRQVDAICNKVIKNDINNKAAKYYCANAYNHIAAIYKQLGKNIDAKNSLKKALKLHPHFPQALNNSGLLYLEENKPDKAEKYFRDAIKTDANYIEAYNNLGCVLQTKGSIDEAIACYKKVLDINPGHAEASYNLGVVYAAKDDLEKAIHYYKQALSVNNKYYDALFNLGVVLYRAGNHEEALAKLQEASDSNPEDSTVYLQLGAISQDLERLDEAIKYYQEAIQHDAHCHEAWFRLGTVYYEDNEYVDAIKALVKSIELKPGLPEAHNMLGLVYTRIRQFDEAEKAFKNSIDLKPDFAEAYNNLWGIYRTRGDRDAAIECCNKALSIKPEYSHVHLNLANSITYTTDNLEHADQIYNLLEQPGLPDRDKMYFHFALGKIYNDAGLYEKAFHHYEIANRLKHNQIKYDRNEYSDYVSRVIDTFTDDFLNKHASFGVQSNTPVFIVGMPRSGTTLVEQIISSHPEAHAGGELPFIHHFEKQVATHLQSPLPFPEVVNDIDEQTTGFLAGEYLKAIQYISANAKRITDKMPNNFLSIGFIKLLFPEAYIIHCMREPLDTCLSIYSLLFSRANEYAYDMEDLGYYYLDYKRIMEHWRSVKSINMFEIQYEELIGNQEKISKDLINYVGLEWDEQCLSFYKKEGYVRTASTEQVRRPIYSSAVGRWLNYKPYLTPLIDIILKPGSAINKTDE